MKCSECWYWKRFNDYDCEGWCEYHLEHKNMNDDPCNVFGNWYWYFGKLGFGK